MRLTPTRPRLRSPKWSTFATSVVLFAGAGSAALLPIVDDGCLSPVASALAAHAVAKTSPAPQADTARAAADQAAVDAAKPVFDAALTTDTDAQARYRAAQEASEDTYDYWDDSDYSITSAQYDVDSAESSLDLAKDQHASYESLRDSYGSDGYGLGDYYDDLVASAQDGVDEATANLKKAKSALTAAKSSRAADERVDASTAAELATAAVEATTTSAALKTARETLDEAVKTKDAHLHTESGAYDAWEAQQTEWRQVAEVADAEREACRESSYSKLGVVGVLALVGGALLPYSFVQRR